jgi:hypothetical protein
MIAESSVDGFDDDEVTDVQDRVNVRGPLTRTLDAAADSIACLHTAADRVCILTFKFISF